MAQAPHANAGMICPLHKQDMSKVCHKCPLWVHLRGKNPQSEQEIDEWNCSLAWLPMLLIEGTQQTRQAGAAIEDFRNRVVAQQDKLNGIVDHLPIGHN
jgi:hypothetical protein